MMLNTLNDANVKQQNPLRSWGQSCFDKGEWRQKMLIHVSPVSLSI